MRVIDSHTEGEPTRVIVDGGPPLGDGPLVERRARFARRVRSFPPLRRQRAARARCDRRGAPLRASRPVLRRRRHLLQQCRLYRHVRPRDDRPCRDACAYGPAQARAPSLRDAGRRGRRGARRRLHGDGRECRELPFRRSGRGRGSGSRRRARRRRLGRQLVLPHFERALRSRVCERGSADGGRDRHPATRFRPKACAARTAP